MARRSEVVLGSSLAGGIKVDMQKTQLCRYFRKNICIYGAECSYAHSATELVQPPKIIRKTQLCEKFKDGFCRNGDACNFAHGEKELVPTFYKTTLCRQHMMGMCTQGSECRFAHSTHERRRTRVLAQQQRQSSTRAKKESDASSVCSTRSQTDDEKGVGRTAIEQAPPSLNAPGAALQASNPKLAAMAPSSSSQRASAIEATPVSPGWTEPLPALSAEKLLSASLSSGSVNEALQSSYSPGSFTAASTRRCASGLHDASDRLNLIPDLGCGDSLLLMQVATRSRLPLKLQILDGRVEVTLGEQGLGQIFGECN